MPTASTLLVFAAATLALLLVPGPSVVYVVARSLEHGRAAGLTSMLGIETGALLHVAAAAAGLTALLASSDLAFSVVKYAGAAYLIGMGVRQVVRRHVAVTQHGAVPSAASRLQLFRDGVLVDLLNPKTGLFFLAFLPQFVDPARGAVATQVLALGLLFVALAAVTDGAYAVVAGGLAGRLSRSVTGRRRIDRTTAGVYVGLGGLAALA
ncbi:MAG TPA: LysE family translocator [Jiangellales bacterium]|nr:LysE family translocator [Jiangellales bacterium]